MDLPQLLAELISIPSVNPMGRRMDGEVYFEHRVTSYLEDWLRALDLPTERQTIEPQRENLVTVVAGDPPPERGGRVLLFDAHQDTVPVTGMTIDPFTPTVSAGRMYGRGSCDVKGGMAAMLAVAARLAREKPSPRPTLVLACTVNEEFGFSGARLLRERLRNRVPSIIPRPPDGAAVAEPTGLDVVVAHKGVVRWRCSTVGRAAHSSQPELGVNAIYGMGAVVSALAEYAKDTVPLLGEHPLCGRPSLSVGTIEGGLSVNTVPDRCTIEIDRRLTPGEDPAAAYRATIERIRERVGAVAEVQHAAPFLQSDGLEETRNGDLARRLSAAAAEVAGRGARLGVPYGTNAATYGCDFPTVVFGPGSIAQAHTADEWLDLDELRAAAEILYRFAVDFA